MAKAYRLTFQQWDRLPFEVKYRFPGVGAQPYHANYHLCSILDALNQGKEVKTSVIHSYNKWTVKNVFERRIRDIKWNKETYGGFLPTPEKYFTGAWRDEVSLWA